jgi:hypothetical protein
MMKLSLYGQNLIFGRTPENLLSLLSLFCSSTTWTQNSQTVVRTAPEMTNETMNTVTVMRQGRNMDAMTNISIMHL